MPERAERQAAAPRRGGCRLLDAFAFSSALVACAAAALTAAAARALGLAPQPAVLALAFSGTMVVYCVDRVRDLERDARTSPQRSAFVGAHPRALRLAAVLGACGALLAAVRVGARASALAAAVAAFGFAHRRLKRFPWAKPLYLTGAWTAVCVGLPAAAAVEVVEPGRLALVAGIVAATVQANVVLSNLRDAEGIAGRLGGRRARTLAAAFCLAALALAATAPRGVRELAALPLAMGTAVAGFRHGERFGAWAVDGALLAGGLGALAASL